MGGKKHVYHEYGTLMSDVWRDTEVDLRTRDGCEPVVDRLRDLFGLPPYKTLFLYNLHEWAQVESDLGDRVRETLFSHRGYETEVDSLLFGSRLINDDCLHALREIPDNSVDFCFADPPYNLRKKYDHWNDDVDSRAYFAWCD